MTSNCAWGSSLYLPDDGKLIFPIVKSKIEMKKKLGINPVYAKSKWVEKEITSEIVQVDPNHKFVKLNPLYRQQLVSKCLRLIGFKDKGKYSKRPLLILEW
jgi:hypothetical protein